MLEEGSDVSGVADNDIGPPAFQVIVLVSDHIPCDPQSYLSEQRGVYRTMGLSRRSLLVSTHDAYARTPGY